MIKEIDKLNKTFAQNVFLDRFSKDSSAFHILKDPFNSEKCDYILCSKELGGGGGVCERSPPEKAPAS